MTTVSTDTARVSAADIAELTARLRRITQAGPAVEPAEREAFLFAKRELLARIEAAQ